MGQWISQHPTDLLIVGLDNSGKTTVVDRLAEAAARSAVNSASDENCSDAISPTVGFSVRRFKFGSTTVNVLDMSGQVQ